MQLYFCDSFWQIVMVLLFFYIQKSVRLLKSLEKKISITISLGIKRNKITQRSSSDKACIFTSWPR